MRALVLSSCLIGLFACGGPKSEPAPPPAQPEPVAAPAPAPAPPKEDQVVVFAAASLRDAFSALAESFKASHEGATVTFNFAGTQELRTQLEQGAAVDVFASADQKHMGELVSAKRVADPVLFARNEPVIVIATESAKKVHGIADLTKVKRLVIGVPEVPIGRYTLQIIDKAAETLGAKFKEKTLANVVSRELNVRQVLAKVTLGEADAGIVYLTDVQSLKDKKDSVAVVSIPPEFNVIAEYPIGVVQGAPHPTLARAFVDLVLSEAGRRALQEAGFMLPPSANPPKSGALRKDVGPVSGGSRERGAVAWSGQPSPHAEPSR
jgi:molybdate transport system substrate-binding protein